MQYSLELSKEFHFNDDETEKIKKCAEVVVGVIKEKNLTYAEAMAVLKQSEILIKSSIIL